jgi:hypothetical protein
MLSKLREETIARHCNNIKREGSKKSKRCSFAREQQTANYKNTLLIF